MVWKKRMLRFQNFVSKISFDDVDQISLEHIKGNQNEKNPATQFNVDPVRRQCGAPKMLGPALVYNFFNIELGRGARGWGAGCSCMCNMIFHSMSRFSSRGVAVC